MKRALLIVFVVALAVPALASAGTRTYSGNFEGGGSLKFKAKVQNGTPIKIHGLKWTKLPLDCAVGGTAPYSSGFSFPVTVARRHFEARGQTRNGDVRSKLDGHFNQHGKKASGYLKIDGSFTNPDFKGCHSGKARFTVK
jgi:hypothetical protein